MKILVPIDFSDVTSLVLDTAIDYAKRLDAELVVLHVTVPPSEPAKLDFGNEDISNIGIPSEPYGFFVRYDVSQGQASAEVKAEHAQLLSIHDAMHADVKSQAILVQGEVVESILREADELAADLIIVGSHGHGMFMRAILGSVSESIIQEGRFPVLVVPAKMAETEEKAEETDE